MMAKIEWYEEILALEPGSKVFFPFARCLAEEGMTERAVHVLRHGLELHPEYFEARVFLAHLLHLTGDGCGCADEVGRVGSVLAAYPGFWEAWSALYNAQNDDTALLLRMLATSFSQGGLRVAQVLAQGVSTGGQMPGEPVTHAPQLKAASEKEVLCPEAAPVASDTGVRISNTPVPASASEFTPVASDPAPVASGKTPVECDGAPEVFLDLPELEEAQPSLCTRSMAEILAEQGDTQGALNIYGQLLERAPAGEEDGLRRRIEELQNSVSGEHVAAGVSAGSSKKSVSQAEAPNIASTPEITVDMPEAATDEKNGKAALRSILETLAGRLEKRAKHEEPQL